MSHAVKKKREVYALRKDLGFSFMVEVMRLILDLYETFGRMALKVKLAEFAFSGLHRKTVQIIIS